MMKTTAPAFNPRTFKVPPRMNQAKLPVALSLIASKGMTTAQAFRAAGYGPRYSKVANGRAHLKPLIKSAQEEFIDQFMAESKSVGLNANKTVGILNHIADNGKDDFAKLGAVKEYHRVILTSLQISARSKSVNPSMTLNQFVLPQTSAESAWKGKAIEAQADEAQAARTLEAEVAEPATRKPVVRTAAYRAGRSAAIRKGHATRKRKALEARKARQAQARRPR